MIVLELEDHAGPAVGEDVLGRIQLPARVRCRIDEPPPGRARPLPRLQSSHASFAEDPCQGRDRWRFKSHRFHPVVDADRTVIQPRRFECGADLNSLVLDLFIELARGGMWSFGAGLEHGRGPIDAGASTEDVERLARDAVLDAERAHRPTRRVIRPPRDGQADSGIDGLVSAHRPFLPAKCHHQEPRKCHRCPDTELSPMSCDITTDANADIGRRDTKLDAGGEVARWRGGEVARWRGGEVARGGQPRPLAWRGSLRRARGSVGWATSRKRCDLGLRLDRWGHERLGGRPRRLVGGSVCPMPSACSMPGVLFASCAVPPPVLGRRLCRAAGSARGRSRSRNV